MNIDAQLVEGAKKGDGECFSQLYELVQDDLYKYALYALGNAHDAEDVVAETFLEAFRGISKLREADAFKGWIFKILSASNAGFPAMSRRGTSSRSKTLPLIPLCAPIVWTLPSSPGQTFCRLWRLLPRRKG